MGRGKNNRRRASLDGPGSAMNNNHFNFSSNGGANNMTISLTNAPTNPQEIEDAIEFHWKNLSLELKRFLLNNPQELCLRKFVDFWTSPLRRENTSPNIAASICGCSWYLALNYMTIGKIIEARALVLNGCFLQQCYNKPIEEITAVALSASDGERFRDSLPFFTDGLLAISTEERMSAFLRNKVSSDYQRRMSFATQTTQSKRKVQDYVNQISSDWNGGNAVATKKKDEVRRRRASLETMPPDSFIEIRFVDSVGKQEAKMRYGLSMTLKMLFKKYAEDRNLSLRQLRFSYEGRTLFLSSVGQKTPQDLGMKHLDSITVVDNLAVSPRRKEEESSSSSDETNTSARSMEDSKNRKVRKNRKAPCRRASWAGHEILGEEERLKLKHSRQLSRVFNEAAPQFEQIRQKLNALNLECTPPKVKGRRKNVPMAIEPLPLINNPNIDEMGGKAGVPFYAVHVGSPDNLYNTKKISPQRGQRAHSIDLHGRTREEALSDLDAKLPEWIDIAMRGAHPFMIRVVIVCGGGNQVLSEAVEGWIRGNENVARAPRNKFSRRRSTSSCVYLN